VVTRSLKRGRNVIVDLKTIAQTINAAIMPRAAMTAVN
jgi:hypothetical protein